MAEGGEGEQNVCPKAKKGKRGRTFLVGQRGGIPFWSAKGGSSLFGRPKGGSASQKGANVTTCINIRKVFSNEKNTLAVTGRFCLCEIFCYGAK